MKESSTEESYLDYKRIWLENFAPPSLIMHQKLFLQEKNLAPENRTIDRSLCSSMAVGSLIGAKVLSGYIRLSKQRETETIVYGEGEIQKIALGHGISADELKAEEDFFYSVIDSRVPMFETKEISRNNQTKSKLRPSVTTTPSKVYPTWWGHEEHIPTEVGKTPGKKDINTSSSGYSMAVQRDSWTYPKRMVDEFTQTASPFIAPSYLTTNARVGNVSNSSVSEDSESTYDEPIAKAPEYSNQKQSLQTQTEEVLYPRTTMFSLEDSSDSESEYHEIPEHLTSEWMRAHQIKPNSMVPGSKFKPHEMETLVRSRKLSKTLKRKSSPVSIKQIGKNILEQQKLEQRSNSGFYFIPLKTPIDVPQVADHVDKSNSRRDERDSLVTKSSIDERDIPILYSPEHELKKEDSLTDRSIERKEASGSSNAGSKVKSWAMDVSIEAQDNKENKSDTSDNALAINLALSQFEKEESRYSEERWSSAYDEEDNIFDIAMRFLDSGFVKKFLLSKATEKQFEEISHSDLSERHFFALDGDSEHETSNLLERKSAQSFIVHEEVTWESEFTKRWRRTQGVLDNALKEHLEEIDGFGVSHQDEDNESAFEPWDTLAAPNDRNISEFDGSRARSFSDRFNEKSVRSPDTFGARRP
ncbi:hypothetical protein HK096_011469 [Nowakowskiella sp. JEL0078]|nr:hypothetical protein HK096_011469 [Nowakowskiella sp. JEL0078]